MCPLSPPSNLRLTKAFEGGSGCLTASSTSRPPFPTADDRMSSVGITHCCCHLPFRALQDCRLFRLACTEDTACMTLQGVIPDIRWYPFSWDISRPRLAIWVAWWLWLVPLQPLVSSPAQLKSIIANACSANFRSHLLSTVGKL